VPPPAPPELNRWMAFALFRIMKRVLLALALCLSSTIAIAQQSKPPRFADYPVTQRFRGKAALINFRSCSLARMFRTKLREAVAQGSNFAGHYGVNYWGCGTQGYQIGIVDLKNGSAYMPGFCAQFGVDTRPNSRLLVVNPPWRLKEEFGNAPPREDDFQTRYYLWRRNRLVLIYPAGLKGKIRNIVKSCEPN
jgi:hypothetical protein